MDSGTRRRGRDGGEDATRRQFFFEAGDDGWCTRRDNRGTFRRGGVFGEAGREERRSEAGRGRERRVTRRFFFYSVGGRATRALFPHEWRGRRLKRVTSAAPPPDSTPDPGGITTRRRRCRRARSPSPGRRAGSFGASRAWRSREGARGGARGSPPGACRRRAWRVDGAWRCAREGG